jgi:hypothetical protein
MPSLSKKNKSYLSKRRSSKRRSSKGRSLRKSSRKSLRKSLRRRSSKQTGGVGPKGTVRARAVRAMGRTMRRARTMVNPYTEYKLTNEQQQMVDAYLTKNADGYIYNIREIPNITIRERVKQERISAEAEEAGMLNALKKANSNL